MYDASLHQTSLVEAKFKALSHRLDEATLRLWAAAEARSLGRGGVSVVAKVAGLSRTTVYVGLSEIEAAGKAKGRSKVAVQPLATAGAHNRVRAPGVGRKRLVDIDASLLADVVEPTRRADLMSALRWTCKSTTRLAAELALKRPSGESAHGVRPPGSTELQPAVGAQDA